VDGPAVVLRGTEVVPTRREVLVEVRVVDALRAAGTTPFDARMQPVDAVVLGDLIRFLAIALALREGLLRVSDARIARMSAHGPEGERETDENPP
jgi:hypothetical protein